MKSGFLFLVLMVLALLSGCAAPKGMGQPTISAPTVSESEFRLRLSEANRKLDAGESQEAMRLYDEVLEEYRSDGGQLECGLRTNLSLAALRAGDRALFVQQSGEARNVCGQVKHLPKNTQLVLAIEQALRGDDQRDLRIASGLFDAVARTLR